jgi:hypothetical protein
MAFLVLVGGLQFLYAVVGGNYVRFLTNHHHHHHLSLVSFLFLKKIQKHPYLSVSLSLSSALIPAFFLLRLQPFNAFLSGFSAAVGQFVLTASLRMQTAEKPPAATTSSSRKSTGSAKTGGDAVTGELVVEGGKGISSERAFADYVFGSLILHGFCVNFIN